MILLCWQELLLGAEKFNHAAGSGVWGGNVCQVIYYLSVRAWYFVKAAS